MARRRRNRRNPSMESWMSQRLKSMDYPECEGEVNATAHYYMLMKEGRDQYPGEDLHELDYAVREALEGAYGKTYISPGVVDALDREGISVEATDSTDWVRDAQSYAEAEQYLAEDNPLFGWGADPNKPKHYLVKSYRYGRRDRGYETQFKRPSKKAAMDYAKSLASEYVRLPQDHRAEIVVYAVYPSGKEQEVWTSYQPSKIAANNPRRAKAPTRKNTGHPKRRNAKLTAADKAKMPLRDFAIPKLRKFPMHTEAYGKKSIQYGQWKSNRHYLPDVKAAVFARYPSLISWWNENHPESPWKAGAKQRRAVSGRTALKQKARQHRSRVPIEKEIADLKRQIAAAQRKRKNNSGWTKKDEARLKAIEAEIEWSGSREARMLSTLIQYNIPSLQKERDELLQRKKAAKRANPRRRKNARLVEQDPKWETEGDWREITSLDGWVETDQHYKGHRLRVEERRYPASGGWDLYIDGEKRGEVIGDYKKWWDATVEAEKLVDAGRSNPRKRKNRRKR